MNLDNLFKQIFILSLTGSILSLSTLLIKNILMKKISAKVHYCIWFLLVIKLIIPLNLQSMINPFNYINNANYQKIEPAYSITQNIPSSTNEKITNNKVLKSTPGINNHKTTPALKFNLSMAAKIWAVGVLLSLLYIIFINVMLSININKSSRCNNPDVNDILRYAKLKLNINSKIPLIYDKSIKSPSVYGIIHPKILISEFIVNNLSTEELKFIFLHELIHIKRKDLLTNIIIVLLQAVYWFNPIIVYSLHQFKEDCELACDEDTIAMLSSNEIIDYGHTIITLLKMLSKPKLNVGTLGFSNKFNKRRIIMISKFNKKSITATVLALSLLLAVGCSSTPKKINTSLNDTKVNTENHTKLSTSNISLNSNSSSNNTITNNEQNNKTSSTQSITQAAKNPAVKGKVKLYEGIYFDNKRFGETFLKNYCEISISNITDTSFDFTIYQVDAEKNDKKVIFMKNTAIFIGDGTKAAFYGKDYTLNFTFPNNHNAYPVVTDMVISGFTPLEGKTYVNNGIPGHEFS